MSTGVPAELFPDGNRRIAVFSGHYAPHTGGVERFTRELWSRLAARGWAVTVVTSNTDRAPAHELDRGMLVVRLPVASIVQDRVPLVLPGKATRAALASVEAWRPQVVVTNTRFFPTTIIGLRLARRIGVPTLHVEHGSAHVDFWGPPGRVLSKVVDHTIGRWSLGRATLCVGVSSAVNGFVRHLSREPDGVLHNGVDVARFAGATAGSARSDLGIGSADLMVLFVGRLIEAKGVLDLLAAVDAVGAADRDDATDAADRDDATGPDARARWHLVVVGEGPLLEDLRSRPRDARGPTLHMLGRLDQARIAALLHACDVFVHPSRYPEGLPTAVLEAAAAGACIVATDIGGTVEILPSPDTGTVVGPGDVGAITAALEALALDPVRRETMGAAAQHHVADAFDWAHVEARAEALLEETLDGAAA